MYEIAIVGGGPAGLAAAVNGRRRNKTTVVIAKEELSSKLLQAHQIENYLALPGISGSELAGAMQRHALGLGVKFVKDEVQVINRGEDGFQLLGRNEVIAARSLILAVGVFASGELKGETDLVGRGVSYCATCDGMFFKGQAVALIGYIPEAETEANFLAEICGPVYYLPQYPLEPKLDPRVQLLRAKPQAILGSKKVSGLLTSAGELAVTGVFIERAGLPAQRLLEGLDIKNSYIRTDASQATNLAGVFAAGDCTGKPWQISRAVGQGQVAALSAVEYLDRLKP